MLLLLAICGQRVVVMQINKETFDGITLLAQHSGSSVVVMSILWRGFMWKRCVYELHTAGELWLQGRIYGKRIIDGPLLWLQGFHRKDL